MKRYDRDSAQCTVDSATVGGERRALTSHGVGETFFALRPALYGWNPCVGAVCTDWRLLNSLRRERTKGADAPIRRVHSPTIATLT